MRPLIGMLLAGATALGAAAGAAERAEAAFTFNFEQQGADVVATGSGSIDLAGLSFIDNVPLPDSGVSADKAIAGVAGRVAAYAGIAGPVSFGAGGHFIASIGGGDAVAVNGADHNSGGPGGLRLGLRSVEQHGVRRRDLRIHWAVARKVRLDLGRRDRRGQLHG
jgi:hypothetical protein